MNLDDITLSEGSHPDRDTGVCLLEAVAWFAGEPHSDRPACTCNVLAAYGRSLNDALLPERDDLEPRLRSLVPRLVGTAGDGLAQRRGLMATDWLTRVYTPALLQLVPRLGEHANTLRGLPPQESWDALPVDELAAAGAAAGAASGAASGAIWDASEAARSALWEAWDATKSTLAPTAPVWAARVVARAVMDMARSALAPTVRELQDSALDMFERMLSVEAP